MIQAQPTWATQNKQIIRLPSARPEKMVERKNGTSTADPRYSVKKAQDKLWQAHWLQGRTDRNLPRRKAIDGAKK
jgi:hypothetical protein